MLMIHSYIFTYIFPPRLMIPTYIFPPTLMISSYIFPSVLIISTFLLKYHHITTSLC